MSQRISVHHWLTPAQLGNSSDGKVLHTWETEGHWVGATLPDGDDPPVWYSSPPADFNPDAPGTESDEMSFQTEPSREKPWRVPGRFGWDGGFGTSAYSDPENDFVGILLTQRLMDSPPPPAVFEDFWTHAYRCFD